jgi:hypothetical protein
VANCMTPKGTRSGARSMNDGERSAQTAIEWLRHSITVLDDLAAREN